MAASPSFAATPHVGAVAVSTANTNRDGTGTIGTVFTAGSAGSVIEEVVVKADGQTAAATIVIYLYDGSTYYVMDEVTVSAITPSATAPSFRASATYSNLIIANGWSLRASITAAPTSGTVKVIALGGDF